MLEAVFYIVIFVIIAGLIMVGTNILYDIAAALIPILAVVIIGIGIIVGFAVAVKNTFSVYFNVFLKKGKQK